MGIMILLLTTGYRDDFVMYCIISAVFLLQLHYALQVHVAKPRQIQPRPVSRVQFVIQRHLNCWLYLSANRSNCLC